MIFDKDQRWQTQPKPYRLPQPFYSATRYLDRDVDPNQIRHGVDFCSSNDHYLQSLAYNAAYSKLVSKLGDQSQWANNLIEARKSFNMMTLRIMQLYNFTRSLRRFQFKKAAKQLGFVEPPRNLTRRKVAKNFGDSWLEFHFGWEPLVKDIGAAMKTLTETDFGSKRINVTSYMRGNNLYVDPYQRDSVLIDQFIRIGLNVRITNPNLHLANQMGVLNPLSILWEAVPFSFVVDWFANVGQVLGSFTDFCGISHEREFVTSYFKSVHSLNTYNGKFLLGRVYEVSRSVGTIPGPTLRLKPFVGFGWQRGLTAMSLLLQGLRGP